MKRRLFLGCLAALLILSRPLPAAEPAKQPGVTAVTPALVTASTIESRLKEVEERERDAERAADRRSKIGSGDRSEKIRTYNFPQGRVTDHRISLTVHRLGEILEGNLDLMLEPLIAEFQAERLKEELS